MDTLRRRWSRGRVSLQTPVIRLTCPGGGSATLVLTAHLGEPHYFDTLAKLLADRPVFYESVRSNSDDPAHWNDSHHRFLRDLREVYTGIADLGMLQYQGQGLAPRAGWVNADVTCCELATRLREEGVSVWRQEMALKSLRGIVVRAQNGDERAARAIVMALQFGLLAASVTAVFSLLSWLPATRRFYRVLNDWRSQRAVRVVRETGIQEFALVYGAAHGESILRELARTGYRETGREWHTVFTM